MFLHNSRSIYSKTPFLFNLSTAKGVQKLKLALHGLQQKFPKCEKQIKAETANVDAKGKAVAQNNTKQICKLIPISEANIKEIVDCVKNVDLTKIALQAKQKLDAAKKGGCKPDAINKLDGEIAGALKKYMSKK